MPVPELPGGRDWKATSLPLRRPGTLGDPFRRGKHDCSVLVPPLQEQAPRVRVPEATGRETRLRWAIHKTHESLAWGSTLLGAHK